MKPPKPFAIMLAEQELITPEEIATARALLAEMRRQQARVAYYGIDAFTRRFWEGRRTFVGNPTEEEFARYEANHKDLPAEEIKNSSMRAAAKIRAKRSYQEEVLPFLEALLNRALVLTQAGSDKLRAAEEAVGKSMGLDFYSPSSTVRAAEHVIQTLKRQLEHMKLHTYGPGIFIDTLRIFGVELEGASAEADADGVELEKAVAADGGPTLESEGVFPS